MKRLQFALLLSIPLCWFFFKLLPVYTHPAVCSVPNFIYAENLAQLKVWCFNPITKVPYDDSSNFLYILSLWVFIHFFKLSTIKAAFSIAAISSIVSVYLLQRIIDSRFYSVNVLLVGLFFMSTQVWTGVLGDEILFQGMLLLFAVRSFWKHRYFWLMIWSSLNVIGRPDTFFMLLPMIVVSYFDIRELKDRYKRKFINQRIRRTLSLFIIPVLAFYTYRYLYFGKILPYNWLHHSLETDKQFGIFNFEAFNYLKHYLRFYTLPLVIGVLFYFLKERFKLHIRYYALCCSLILIPAVYVCTFSQDENLGFKNYYFIYLGLIILPLLFIRDFRSISQGLATAVFVVFFGFKISFQYLQKTLQSYTNNEFYIAYDLAQIQKAKVIAEHTTFLDWLTEWETVYVNGQHSKEGKTLSTEEILAAKSDLIISNQTTLFNNLEKDYAHYSIPKSTRQYEKETKPENSLDQFFYKNARKIKVDRNDYFKILVRKSGNHYEAIKETLENHGGEEVSF